MMKNCHLSKGDNIMSKQEAFNEYDMLKGNINRMFVTNNCEEFQKMYEFALKRLERIYDYNYHRLVDDELPFK